MQIQRLKLKNIRSYEEEEIKFPEGITLLSGNIGSGKSTMLIAIEFALFGLIRSDLSGASLLRNGKENGYVIVDFKIGNKNISIKRTLKKGTNTITQDACYFSVDDKTEQLTTTELKQRVFEIFSYPQETLTKKSMIYRYTVYTPQEEMKAILLGEKELRQETLRRVFNVDKYKRVRENCKIITSELKTKKKVAAAYIYDLETKKENYSQNYIRALSLNKQIKILETAALDLANTINLEKEKINQQEENILKLNNLKREFEILQLNIKLKEESKIKNANDHDKITNEIGKAIIQEEIDIIAVQKEILEIDNSLTIKENELKSIMKETINLNLKTKNSQEIKNKIQNLDNCPLCQQQVNTEHKHSIITKEDENIKQAEEKLETYLKEEKKLQEELENTRTLLEQLKQKDKQHEINKIKTENLKYKSELITKIKDELEKINAELKLLKDKSEELVLQLDLFKTIEEEYKNSRNKLDNLLTKQNQCEIEKAKLQQDHDNIERSNQQLKTEIEEKENVKQKLEYYLEIQDYLENRFNSLVELIERKIMLKIHNDFNNLFQNWFGMMIDTENMKVKLDEEFTPIIEQNGYDLEYANLSGGEKTACALAYRLGLNQVINNIITNINTKDLIILDEPTDGFSTEQLDRLRNVLEELKMKQIIIVSHENKIESFADNVIRIKKEGHVSQVIN